MYKYAITVFYILTFPNFCEFIIKMCINRPRHNFTIFLFKTPILPTRIVDACWIGTIIAGDIGGTVCKTVIPMIIDHITWAGGVRGTSRSLAV